MTTIKKGYMSAQDEGSFEIAKFVDPQENERILDCCAAPGTKSMAMAEMMHNKGHIDAYDLHAHRKDLIENDAKRLESILYMPAFKMRLNLKALICMIVSYVMFLVQVMVYYLENQILNYIWYLKIWIH